MKVPKLTPAPRSMLLRQLAGGAQGEQSLLWLVGLRDVTGRRGVWDREGGGGTRSEKGRVSGCYNFET